MTLSASILLIAFMTSFFRLSFNKQFFDQIDEGRSQVFILAKSWYTQFGVAVWFGVLALVLLTTEGQMGALSIIYSLSAPMALVYLLYARQTYPVANVCTRSSAGQ